MTRVPSLPVSVASWVIGDHGDRPRVGRTEQYDLGFAERPDPDEPGAHDRELVAEPQHGGEPRRTASGDDYWDVLLHGEGWAAHWRSSRPVPAGPVRLRGSLFWNWPDGRWSRTRVRGRVERVRPEIRDGQEIGVVVTLDPARAALMPDAIAAHGDDLWVADRDRPAVLRVRHPRGPRPEVTEFGWEAGGAWDRALHADATGCWVTDTTGVRRIEPGHGVRLVDDTPVGGVAHGPVRHRGVAAAGADGTLAVILATATGDDPRDRLRRYRPDGTADDVVLPTLADVVVADGDGFLVQWIDGRRHPVDGDPEGDWALVRGSPSTDDRIGRVDAGGAVTTGPQHEHRAVLIGPDPPVRFTSSSATRRVLRGVRPARTTLDVNRNLPVSTSSDPVVWVRAGRVFVAGHLEFAWPPDPGGPSWPFAGRPTRDGDASSWFAELDAETLELRRAVTVPWAPRHVDVDGAGTVWMQADTLQASRVHLLPVDHPHGTPAPWVATDDLR